MINSMCIICRDKNKFITKINNTKRICNSLDLIIKKYEKIEIKINKQDILKIYSMIPTFKPTCSYCHNLNTLELQNIEKKLAEAVVRLKNILESECISKEEKKCLKNNANTFLRGFYPPLSRYILKV